MLKLYDPDAEKILTAVRNSASNRRMVIYGIARNTKEALRFSSYGINAVMDEPLERQSVLKVVRTLMGSTNPRDAAPGTIRGDLAIELTENLVHGSDSLASAEREVALFFPNL